MNCSSIYIFKDKEDRQNIEMYQKLSEIIFEYDKGCAIRADNIARAKRKDKFYGDYDTPYMREKKPEPYFTTEKGDLFLWVSGQYCSMSTEELIDFVDMTDERLEILSKVMIGYTKHVNGGYWFEDLEEPKMPEPQWDMDSKPVRWDFEAMEKMFREIMEAAKLKEASNDEKMDRGASVA